MITIVGSVNMDLVVRVARHPVPGETLLGSDYSMHPGGKGANQAVAVARLGGPVRFVGRVGSDAFGRQLRSALELDGVDTSALDEADRPSGVAFIQVDGAGQNSIVVSPGANFALHAADLPDAAFEGTEVVVLQLEIMLGTMREAARRARLAGAEVILNLAPAQELSADDLKDVSLLVVNETEAATLLVRDRRAVTADAQAAARALAKLVERVVLTMGARGAVWAEPADPAPGSAIVDHVRVGQMGAFEVDAVDTTAAGDAFVGALAVHLAEHPEGGLGTAVRFASAAGALATTREGAQSSLPDRAEVDALLSAREGP